MTKQPEPSLYKMYLAGDWVDAAKHLVILNPFDQSEVGTVPCATETQITTALALAENYSDKPLNETQRSELLDKWATEISQNIEPLSILLTCESGKPIQQSRGEVLRAVQTIRCYSDAARTLNESSLKLIEDLISSSVVSTPLNSEGFITASIYQPLGVVTAYTPFNFPANTLVHKIASAIAGGNAIVVKPSEKTPLVALELAKLLANCNEPKGIVSVLTGNHEDFTDLFLTHPVVNFFSMTGNSEVGKALYRKFSDAKPFNGSHFELGGNAPQIVLEDFSAEQAAEMLCAAVFEHNGSRCTTPRKILVPQGDYCERFTQKAAECAAGWQIGNPLDDDTRVGSLIDVDAAKIVEQRIKDATEKGAILLHGGKRIGAIIPPTILVGVTPEMRIFTEENFGPVMCILTYSSTDEAIRIGNLGDFGLQPAVMTNDFKQGWEISSKLRGGCLNIGTATTSHRSDMVPFGGIGASGVGKEGSIAGVTEMCRETPYKFYLPDANSTMR